MTQRVESQSDNTPLAIAVILLTVLALSLGDALIKQTSTSFVLWQIFVLRSIIAVPFLFLVIRLRYASVPLMPRAMGWTSLRSLMLTFMWVAYYASLPHLELSIAAAAYYTLADFHHVVLCAPCWRESRAPGLAGYFPWIRWCPPDPEACCRRLQFLRAASAGLGYNLLRWR